MSALVSERYPLPKTQFLKTEFKAHRWENVEPILLELEGRPLGNAGELEQWLLDRSELEAQIAARGSRLMVATACKTNDKEAEKAYLEFQTGLIPKLKPIDDRLDRRFLACPYRQELSPHDWYIYTRATELAVELFREENVVLEADEEERALEHGQVTGAMTVDFQGETRTLAGMAHFAEDADRKVREQAWRTTAGRRLEDRQQLAELFDDLVQLRQAMAQNAGFANYREYKHLEMGRLDYEADDCLVLQENIEKHVLPVLHEMDEARRRHLELEVLRPWDFVVDPRGASGFKPFENEQEQIAIGATLLGKVDQEFEADLYWMAEKNLLDLATRPHKRGGGFMDTFEDVRHPFIFSNSGFTHGDVETLVHEGGHAIHALLSRHLEPVGYRMPPLEFAEVASMGMECLAMEHLEAVYPPQEAKRCVIQSLEGIVRSFSWIATIDSFQHQLYADVEMGASGRQALWLKLRERFGSRQDWSGLEKFRAWEWQRTLHLYEVPFYYVEYAIAQNGALQVWDLYRKNPSETIKNYRQGLALGGTKPLGDLFTAAGLVFDPRGEKLAELMALVSQAWEDAQGEN